MSLQTDIDSLLQPFQHFGVNLGLERIQKLLAAIGSPHHQVPIIHVAGTNGKGSVCAYLSSILTEAGYRVGRYTSPHLIDWTERIYLNEQPITKADFIAVLQAVIEAISAKPRRGAIALDTESPTLFEVVTAAAWLYFAQQQVDIAVMEVGLGGRLDATNVCDRPLVSIIVSISREHWQRLGSTLTAITTEKAGVLKSNCPAVIGKLPPEATAVVKAKVTELNCPTIWVEPAELIESPENPQWAKYQDITYPLPLLGAIQLHNSAIAIAVIQELQKQGWAISETAIQQGMAKTRWLGRLQWLTWRDRPLLIDGAHNPTAAIALRQYLDTLQKPVTFIMGILSTKDHREIFEALLRPKDALHLVPVPDHSTAEPAALAALAQQVCPQLRESQTYSDLLIALETVWQQESERLVVFCGSLYLIGYFFRNYHF
ncbi:MAG TPA: bifunctional folylpolyglutamate synthase/dihydrofolate synthase [Xenococcaceae cyanobacterium]